MPRKKGKVKNTGSIIAIVIALSAVAFLAAQYLTWQFGKVSGKMSIGPFCPVERTPPVSCGPSDIYSSRRLIFQPLLGSPTYVQLNQDGTFNVSMAAGTYKVSLTDCTFIGCGGTLPKTIDVRPNQVTYVKIDIDTGIR